MSVQMFQLLISATGETLLMVLVAAIVAIIGGVPLGVLLRVTRHPNVLPAMTVNRFLSIVVNIVRSVPFIILMVTITPLTQLLVGTSIGTVAAMVPLAVAAIPFLARMVESATEEVSDGLIEAANAMGATPWQIITKVLLPEALPGIVRGVTIMIIALIGYSAMAGAIGGGGLGDVGIRYGYERFQWPVMVATVVILVLIVQCVQWLGDRLALYLRKAGEVL